MTLIPVQVLLAFSFSLTLGEEVRITTKLGTIVGQVETWHGVDIMTFKGIPYAKPPTGPLRFRPPQAITEPWTTELVAQEFGNSCPQPGIPIPPNSSWPPSTSEDCLYLNIWAPLQSSTNVTKLPVLIWIHGGAFFALSSSFFLYNGGFLAASQNLIVVTFNYRLGPLGLLYGGHPEEAPGNVALLDQLEVFKWTSENIDVFHGDSKSITIGGQSAGGMSVSLHLLSSMSKPYFTKAIVMSGVGMNPVTVESRETALKRAKGMSSILGCSPNADHQRRRQTRRRSGLRISASSSLLVDDIKMTDDGDSGQMTSSDSLSKQELDCLRNLSFDKLIQLQNKPEIIQIGNKSLMGFWPVWGTDFLPDSPQKMLNTGQFNTNVSVLFGSVPNEGYAIHLIYTGLTDDYFYVPDKSAEFLLRQLYHYVSKYAADIVNEASPHIMDKYFPDGPETSDEVARRQYYKVLGELCFDCPSVIFMEKLASSSTNKVYQFVFEQPIGGLRFFLPFMMCDTFGPCHGDDVYYLFGFPLRLPFVSEKNRQMSFKFMKTIAEFSRTGVAPWPAYNQSPDGQSIQSQYYLFNDVSGARVLSDYKKDTCSFWKSKVYYNI